MVSGAEETSVDFTGEILGRGSFGVVFPGKYKGKQVAWKVMLAGRSNTHREIRRLFDPSLQSIKGHVCTGLGYLKVVADLSKHGHPLVRDKDPGKDRDGMDEYVAVALPLAFRSYRSELCNANYVRDPFLHKALRDLQSMAQPLAKVHEAGWVVVDFKPDNILECHNGSFRLGDLASFRRLDCHRQHQFARGTLEYTPQYFEQEVLESRVIDDKTDLYAFGKITEEMLDAVQEDDPSLTVTESYQWLTHLAQRCTGPSGARPTAQEVVELLSAKLRADQEAYTAWREAALQEARALLIKEGVLQWTENPLLVEGSSPPLVVTLNPLAAIPQTDLRLKARVVAKASCCSAGC